MTRNRKTNAAIAAVAFIASGGVAIGAQQDGQQPQGLYSAEQLLGAQVYATGSSKQVGEIEDIIFTNDMSIESFAVQTESSFGLGGKSYVVVPGQISVQAEQGDEATEPKYRVMLDADAEQLRQNPVYSDSWWNKTQQRASEAWQATRETAGSAWTNLKEGAATLVDQTGDAAGEAADETADATQNVADAAADETEKGTDNASN